MCKNFPGWNQPILEGTSKNPRSSKGRMIIVRYLALRVNNRLSKPLTWSLKVMTSSRYYYNKLKKLVLQLISFISLFLQLHSSATPGNPKHYFIPDFIEKPFVGSRYIEPNSNRGSIFTFVSSIIVFIVFSFNTFKSWIEQLQFSGDKFANVIRGNCLCSVQPFQHFWLVESLRVDDVILFHSNEH